MTPEDRRTSVVVLVVGGVLLAGLAAWLVPWHPVPGGTPGPAAPGSVFTQAQVDRAEAFSSGARWWSWSSLAVSLLVACWFGFTRVGGDLVERLRGPWWWRVVLAVVGLELVGRVVTLPFAVLLHRHLVAYGLSTQPWSGFAADVARSELVAVVTTSLALVVLVGCARRWRRAWPAVAGGLLACLVLVGSFVYPLLVEPLFNSFTPLPDGDLRTRILALADAEHVPVDDVLVADASRRTTTLNAYVSGFGGTRRVVVYDNLVRDLPEDQALSVVAHELAHARHDDVLVGSVLGAAGALAGVGLLGLLVGALGRRRSMGDPAVVPLVLALVALGTLLASPVQNTVSRMIETRADVDALEATHDPTAFEAMQRELALKSLADPTPPAWSQLWFGSHPTTLTRIAIARQLADRTGEG
ncbi:M48 family metallopeptidase [Nocardioides sp. MAHUQ-72]|uniref:M48 family metallopeptidase n=1 Tax=unclassified Nocardioides TaxID=2615069 RepID=UPI00360768F3